MKDLKHLLLRGKKELIKMIEEKTALAGKDGFGCGLRGIYCNYIIYDVFALFFPCKIERIHRNFVQARLLCEGKTLLREVCYKPSSESITIHFDYLDIGTLQLILMHIGGPHIEDWEDH